MNTIESMLSLLEAVLPWLTYGTALIAVIYTIILLFVAPYQ